MANTVQARKRARQATEQRAHNMSQRSTLRTAIKKVRKAIEAGDKSAAQAVFKESQAVIDSIADKTWQRARRAAFRPRSRHSERHRRASAETKRLPRMGQPFFMGAPRQASLNLFWLRNFLLRFAKYHYLHNVY